MIELTIEHIRTSAGSRFSTYTSDEDRREQLIQYWNEVHAADSELGELDEDTDLETVVDAIEEIEDIDTEELWLPSEFKHIEGRERDTILAALRLWQHAIEGTTGDMKGLIEIATNDREEKDGVPPALGPGEIDDLCERLNT